MSRINTNVVSLTAQRNLASANLSVNQSLERLSTGLRINRGSDDPAGLIASERLRSEKVALNSAISNNTRATNLIATAEASLNEINGLLLDVQGLVDTAANSGGMTVEEVAANQLLVDEAIDSITRIASTAQFNGKKLLDGSLGGYTTDVATVVEADAIDISKIDMAGNPNRTLYVNYDGTSTAATKGTLEVLAANVAAVDGVITISGNLGTAQVDMAGQTGATDIAARIAAVEDQTGVTAANVAGDVVINSQEYGSTQFVSIGLGAGGVITTQDVDANAVSSDYGSDIALEGVGFTSGTTDMSGVSADGLVISIRRDDMEITVDLAEAEAALDGEAAITITGGGGAKFQIGAEINSSNQITVAIANVDADHLGTATVLLSSLKTNGANELSSDDLSTAATVVGGAIDTISSLRGRLGAVQKNTLETQIRSLGSTLENITSAESVIRDTDFAEETANLTRAQILVQAGTSVLAMANSAPQNVLALLRG